MNGASVWKMVKIGMVLAVALCWTVLTGAVVMADDGTPAMDWQDVLIMLLKQVLPILGAFFSSYITKAMLWLMDAAGAKWSPVLTTVIGMVTSGVSAAMLGQSADMSTATAAVGAATGAASHVVMQSKPLATEPKPEPV